MRLRFWFLLAILACLVAAWLHQRTRYWAVNGFADEAASRGAGIDGTYDSASSIERYLERHIGLKYPARLNRIDRVDMLTARDIDGLLARIDDMPEVSCLKIGPGLRSPDSLEPLGKLANLTDLIIVARNADDRWLEAASHAPQLRRVTVRDGRITDRGLELLSGVRSLRTLRIPDSTVTDAGIAKLAQAKELVELDLRGSAVTDASIPILLALPNLKELNVVRTGITPAGAETLRAGGTRRVFQ